MTVLNAVTVECYRDLMVCFESVASLTSDADSLRREGHLMSLGLRYHVERWSNGEIVALAQTPATDVRLNIDPVGSVVVRTLRETNERGARGADVSLVERWILR